MGTIESGSVRHIGPGKGAGLDQSAQKKNLLIFKEPLFDTASFGVRNDGVVPGHDPSDFEGTDNLGWGVHPNGSINVIDATECNNGFGPKSVRGKGITFQTLWGLEASPDEIAMAKRNLKEGYRKFLSRMIKSVTLSKSGVQTIPDPMVWLIQITLERSQSIGPNLVGTLVPWPRPTPEAEKERMGTFELRPVNIEFKGREDQQWPKTRSPAE